MSDASNQPDLAPITRHLRSMYSSRLLVAAVCHLKVFDELAAAPLAAAELQRRLGLADRPAMVLFPALCAMGMLSRSPEGTLSLTPLSRALLPREPWNLVGYVALEGDDPGVLDLVDRLRRDGPADESAGVSYVKEGDAPSPMDDPKLARWLTLALAGRARRLSSMAAAALPRVEGHLLDAAGGTGFFAYEWLLANPRSTATVFDRPAVLAVAAECLDDFALSKGAAGESVRERVTLAPGDMLRGALPRADLVLAASLFHDWPAATCARLARRFAEALPPGGELWAHDAFLDDSLDGPLAAAEYSAALFTGTKGRIYSRAEHHAWFREAGLEPAATRIATALDYGLISAVKPR